MTNLSDTTFPAAADVASAGFALLDEQGRVAEVNEAFCELVGYAREELIGQDADSFVEKAIPVSVLTGRRLEPVAIVWRTRGGGGVPLTLRHSAPGEEGMHGRLKLSPAPARAVSSDEHRHLIELSPDLYLIHDRTKIVYVNRAGVRLLGAVSSLDIIGKALTDFVDPSVGTTLRRRLAQIVDEGLQISPVEEQFVRLDGSGIDVELFAVPFMHDEEDAILIVARDITERKQAQSMLKRSVSLLQSTLDSTADGILVLDLHRQVVSFNQSLVQLWRIPRDILGEETREQILDYLLSQVADKEQFLSRVNELFSQPEAEGYEVFELKDGRIFERFSLPHRYEGNPIGRVWSFRDITDRKRHEEATTRRDGILQAVGFAAQQFFTSDDWQSCITEVIRRLGEAAKVSRAYIFENHTDEIGREIWSQRFEWVAAGISPQIDNPELQKQQVRPHFERWQWMLTEGQIVAVHVKDLQPPVRTLMESQAIRSILLVPILIMRRLWGFIGFDECERLRDWTVVETEALRVAAQTLGAALQRRRSEEALRRSEERFRLLFERNLAGVYRTSLDGRVLDCNTACARIFGYSSREELIAKDASTVYGEKSERHLWIERLRLARTLSNQEVCLRRRDGTPVWVLENVTMLETDGEEILEGTLVDITDRKIAEQALRESEERYRLMAHNSSDMISRLTADGVFLYASPACRHLLGFEPDELIGRPMRTLVHPQDFEEIFRSQSIVLQHAESHSARFRMRRRDGSYAWFETTSRTIRSPHTGEASEIVAVSRDISERKLFEEQIEYRAYHDALTGLPNRSLFSDRLTVALARARRFDRRLAVMFLDIDHFKTVNDTLGHAVGDQLLRELAARLRECLREEDTVARLGGDEFTLLIGDVADEQAALGVAEKVLRAVVRPFPLGTYTVHVTTSIGIAVHPDHGADAESLVEVADKAMYRAKGAGRNNVQVATAEDLNGN